MKCEKRNKFLFVGFLLAGGIGLLGFLIALYQMLAHYSLFKQ